MAFMDERVHKRTVQYCYLLPPQQLQRINNFLLAMTRIRVPLTLLFIGAGATIIYWRTSQVDAFVSNYQSNVISCRKRLPISDAFLPFMSNEGTFQYLGKIENHRFAAPSDSEKDPDAAIENEDDDDDDDDDDVMDYFKLGQQLARELKESANLEEESTEKHLSVGVNHAKDSDEAEPLLEEAQAISLAAVQSLVNTTSAFCETKQEELKAVKTEIQVLQEKLVSLREQEVRLKKEAISALAKQEHSIEQEQAVIDSFRKLSLQNKNKNVS